MAKLKVKPDELRKAATNIETYAGDYQEKYEELYRINEEMETTWPAKDEVAYIEKIKGFQDDLQKMYQLMMDYAAYLRSTAQAYETTQQDIIDKANRLTN